jgi:hypothetical protein
VKQALLFFYFLYFIFYIFYFSLNIQKARPFLTFLLCKLKSGSRILALKPRLGPSHPPRRLHYRSNKIKALLIPRHTAERRTTLEKPRDWEKKTLKDANPSTIQTNNHQPSTHPSRLLASNGKAGIPFFFYHKST